MIDLRNPRQVRSLSALLEYVYNRYTIMDRDAIEEVGYNEWSGYVYVVYDGISLALFEGRTDEGSICIFAFDEETGDEIAYDSLEDYYKKVQV
jgi:hypothetical protein